MLEYQQDNGLEAAYPASFKRGKKRINWFFICLFIWNLALTKNFWLLVLVWLYSQHHQVEAKKKI